MKKDELVKELFGNNDSIQRIWKIQFHKILKDEGISFSQMSVLYLAKHKSPLKSVDIANYLQITPSATTQLLEYLENEKFIERYSEPNDKRANYIKLSRKGLAKSAKINKKRMEFFRQITESLTEEELSSLSKIYKKIIDQF